MSLMSMTAGPVRCQAPSLSTPRPPPPMGLPWPRPPCSPVVGAPSGTSIAPPRQRGQARGAWLWQEERQGLNWGWASLGSRMTKKQVCVGGGGCVAT